MSQEKVDKRKYEKKHRKEIEEKNKRKNTISICLVAVGFIAIGVLFGFAVKDVMTPKDTAMSIEDLREQLGEEKYAELFGTPSDAVASDEEHHEELEMEAESNFQIPEVATVEETIAAPKVGDTIQVVTPITVPAPNLK